MRANHDEAKDEPAMRVKDAQNDAMFERRDMMRNHAAA